jgi:hypothetical protein
VITWPVLADSWRTRGSLRASRRSRGRGGVAGRPSHSSSLRADRPHWRRDPQDPGWPQASPQPQRGRGTVQAGPGCGAEPRVKKIAPQAHRCRAERGAAPKGARSQPGGRSRNGAWGNWTQARSPRQRGRAAAACGQGGNAPGCTSPPGVRERDGPHAERRYAVPRSNFKTSHLARAETGYGARPHPLLLPKPRDFSLPTTLGVRHQPFSQTPVRALLVELVVQPEPAKPPCNRERMR